MNKEEKHFFRYSLVARDFESFCAATRKCYDILLREYNTMKVAFYIKDNLIDELNKSNNQEKHSFIIALENIKEEKDILLSKIFTENFVYFNTLSNGSLITELETIKYLLSKKEEVYKDSDIDGVVNEVFNHKDDILYFNEELFKKEFEKLIDVNKMTIKQKLLYDSYIDAFREKKFKREKDISRINNANKLEYKHGLILCCSYGKIESKKDVINMINDLRTIVTYENKNIVDYKYSKFFEVDKISEEDVKRVKDYIIYEKLKKLDVNIIEENLVFIKENKEEFNPEMEELDNDVSDLIKDLLMETYLSEQEKRILEMEYEIGIKSIEDIKKELV